jgi:hypothetical protein
MDPRRKQPGARLPVDPDECRWANAKGTIQGMPAFVRINTTLQEMGPCPGFGHEVSVLIHFTSAGDNGLPESEDDLSAVDEIEDLCKERLEAGGTAALALVITSGGTRELTFYSSDPQAAVTAWEYHIQPRVTTHRAELLVRPDGRWEALQQFA